MRSSSGSSVGQDVGIRSVKARATYSNQWILKAITARDTTISLVCHEASESSIEISTKKNANRASTGQECCHRIFSGRRYAYAMKIQGV